MSTTVVAVAPYVAGSIITLGGTNSLLTLIRNQLQPNAPGSATELRVESDEQNSTTFPVYLGMRNLRGPLSASNYGVRLDPASVRVYSSAFPGSSTALGSIQVFSTVSQRLNVEVVV